jgi:hypothetical protein
VISLGETLNFHLGGEAGFHLDSSDHIFSLEKCLIGTVEEPYQYHVESTLFQGPDSLVLAGDLCEEDKGQMFLYALLTPLLINHERGGEALFLSFKYKVESLLSRPVEPGHRVEINHEEVNVVFRVPELPISPKAGLKSQERGVSIKTLECFDSIS